MELKIIGLYINYFLNLFKTTLNPTHLTGVRVPNICVIQIFP